MTLEQLPGWAREMLEAGRVARLAFADEDDHPRALPVTYALLGGDVWSAVDDVKPKASREPARLRHLRRRPRAALVVDRYSDDWSELAWVQLLGEVEVVEASGASAALAELARKYEPYAASPPPGPLLRLRPSRALSWRAAD